jgi:hypothetical protein
METRYPRVKVRIDRLVVDAGAVGARDLRGLEAAVGAELSRLIAGKSLDAGDAVGIQVRELARRVAAELYRKMRGAW